MQVEYLLRALLITEDTIILDELKGDCAVDVLIFK